jgi:hypothetical protein
MKATRVFPPNQEPNRVLASKIFLREGASERLDDLLAKRVCRDLCLECGTKRDGSSDYCSSCAARFSISTEVLHAYDGWKYQVTQFRPAFDAPAFRAERVPILERRGHAEWIGNANTFAEAEKMCEKKLNRALVAVGC